MPKVKTNRAAKKRYTQTAKGKFKRTTAGRRHLLSNKTTRQKLNSRRPSAYADKTCENAIKKLLPYGN